MSAIALGSVQPSRKKQAFYWVSLFLVKNKMPTCLKHEEVGWDLALVQSYAFFLNQEKPFRWV